MAQADRPNIAVSSCILGQRVRYDAEIKHYPELLRFLEKHFVITSVCPEVEIGLTVPRPPVQLQGDIEQPRMIGRDDPCIDVTDLMQDYCRNRPQSLTAICGYVFKSRSPSCGIHDTPLFGHDRQQRQLGSGLFARAIRQSFSGLPIVDETELASEAQRQHYLQLVLNYYQGQPQ